MSQQEIVSGPRMTANSAAKQPCMSPAPPPGTPPSSASSSIMRRRFRRTGSPHEPVIEDTRPLSSSLTKYKLIPSIRSAEMPGHVTSRLSGTNEARATSKPTKLLHASGDAESQRKLAADHGTEAVFQVERTFGPEASHTHTDNSPNGANILPPEPELGEDRLLLAVKSPNGDKVQRNFRPTDSLQTILNFAATVMQQDLTGHLLLSNATRTLFERLDLTLQEAAIENRTLLYLQPPPPRS